MMTRWPYAAAVLFVMACGEPRRAPMDACAGEVCTDDQRCDQPTLHCVTNELPRLVLIAPTTVVSDPSFELTGSVTDDTEGTTLEWRDGVSEWQPLQLDDDGSFAFTVPARELDAEPMHLTVRADDGTKKVERSTIVIVDRAGPKLELKSPLPGSTSGGSTLTVTVVARDGSEGLQELRIAGQNVAAPRTGTELSAVITIPAGDRRSFPVAVMAKDLNGNRTTQSFGVQVDGVGPTLRFLSPTAQSRVINTPSLRVEVEATDPSEVQKVRFAIDDGGFVDAQAQDGGVWSAQFAMPLVEQHLTFFVDATDRAGNKSSSSVMAQLDRVPPAVAVTAPDLGSIHNTAFDVAVQASDDAVSVTATFAGTTIPLVLASDDRWHGQMPLTATRDYSEEFVVAAASDAAGNQQHSAPWRLFIDTVAPTLSFTTPAANAKLNGSNFVGRDEVTIAWQVQDADPQAATVSVDGVPTTTNDVRITTQASDDGRVISKTVIVGDRMGNLTTGSLTFSVDRLAPTVISWLPAANARNVEQRSTTVTFSERVSGPTTSTNALRFSPGQPVPGTWNAAHTSWTTSDLAPYTVITATLGDLADDFGNPVAISSRKFHTAAFVPPSGLVLARDVSSFDATSDGDGIVTVAVTVPSGYRVFRLSPTTGQVEPASISEPNGGEFSLNSSLTVDPATLVATHRVGSARYGGVGTGPLPAVGLVRHLVTNGVAHAIGSTVDAPGAVVSQGAFPGEADASQFALIDGSTYVRGAASRTLSSSPNLVVAQAGYTWAGFSASSTALRWSRFLCVANLFGSPTCSAFTFSAPTSNPVEVRAAIAPDNRCLVATWKSGTADYAVFQPLAYCDEPRPTGSGAHASCLTNQVLTASALKLRVAPFSGASESTLLAAWESGGVRVGKMNNPAACTNAFTPVGSPLSEPATSYEPVQLGNKPALLYTDASRSLKLYVP